MRDVDPTIAVAVRAGAKRLAERFPGQTIELRIPPYTAVQLGVGSAGPRHRRGTPGSVVEMDGVTFLDLLSGELSWQEGLATHRISASGAHHDLSWVFLG